MIKLTELGKDIKAFGKFELGRVISDPYARAFAPQVNEAEKSEDHEVSMAQNQLDAIIKAATELKEKMGMEEKQIPAWIQDHITNSENYITQAATNYHEYGDSNESVNESIITEDIDSLYLAAILVAQAAALGGNIGALAAHFSGDDNLGPIDSIKQWWKNRKDDKAIKSIIAKIKSDPELIAFFKLSQNQQKGKFRKLVATKLSNDELQYLNRINKTDLQKNESVNEGKKVFKVNPQIGKAKYSISYHDGVKKHKDGSDFFDIEIFKNKVDLEKAIKNYKSKGFIEESINEAGPCWKGYKQVGMKMKNGNEVPNCVPEGVVKEARGVPKIFVKTAAVEKKIKELMADRKKAVVPYNNETDPAKKEKLKQILIKLTNQIKGYEKNLVDLRDMEERYIQQMQADVELDPNF